MRPGQISGQQTATVCDFHLDQSDDRLCGLIVLRSAVMIQHTER